MNQFITLGYARARMDHAVRMAAATNPTDRWAPPPRGPGIADRVGHRLVAVGAGLIKDRRLLERTAAEVLSRAA